MRSGVGVRIVSSSDSRLSTDMSDSSKVPEVVRLGPFHIHIMIHPPTAVVILAVSSSTFGLPSVMSFNKLGKVVCLLGKLDKFMLEKLACCWAL